MLLYVFRILFLFKAEWYFTVGLYHHTLFIHSSISRRLSCLHLLAAVNATAMNFGALSQVTPKIVITPWSLPTSLLGALPPSTCKPSLRLHQPHPCSLKPFFLSLCSVQSSQKKSQKLSTSLDQECKDNFSSDPFYWFLIQKQHLALHFPCPL